MAEAVQQTVEKKHEAIVEKTDAPVVLSTPDNLEKVAQSVKEKLAARKQQSSETKPVEKATSKVDAAVEKKATDKKAEKAVDKKAEKSKTEKVEYVLQRKAIIPLVNAYAKPAKKRAGAAIKLIRKYAARHAKTTEDKVKIDEVLAAFVNSRGAKHPPKKLTVSLLKDKQGIVKVVPA